MNLDNALRTFFSESRELLLSMEDALMQLEREPADEEAIGATFRAIHTIKGSAGLFALDDIERFAHRAETVLGRAREGEIAIDAALCSLLLQCADHVSLLVSIAADEHIEDAAGEQARAAQEQSLLAALSSYEKTRPELPAATARQPAPPAPAAAREAGVWHLSLRLARDVLRHGMDPAPFIRYLSTLGDVVNIVTLCDALPSARKMDAEACYLGFEIDLLTAADKAAIEAAFEFVREDCELRLVPPDSQIDEYLRLIESLPEDTERLGEILIASGALTRIELEEWLARQQAMPEEKPKLGELLVQERIAPPAVVEAALEKQKRGRERRSQDKKLVRVDADKLDELINMVGEMVIASASAALMARRFNDGALLESMSLLDRMVEQIRDHALALRMVEIGETFHRFQRVVRDVSHESGKDIALEVSGEDTELDKSVVERISDPLLHLVRNAVDHGIESPERRAAAGKSARGTVRLNAYHESGSIVIEVADDGGGLDKDRILKKAIERGIAEPGQNLSDEDIWNFIFAAGFSTAEQVTNLSGRGVGMDVVRRSIESLRGTIELHSQPGQGTTFRIRLPLTLAIIDGFLIEAGGASFVVPLDMVVECMELPPAEAGAAPRHYLNMRNEVLPLLHLRQALGVDATPVRRENVVVVRFGNRKAGVVVDRLLGEFQTVIKPLGQVFRHLRGIAGSTILGSGQVALILDVPVLMQQAAEQEAADHQPAAALSVS
jgi:two-component system chemotaxis sensor kinase CheA